MITLILNGKEILVSPEKFESFGSFYEAYKVPGEVLAFLSVNEQEIPVDRVQELASAKFEGEEKVIMNFEPAVSFTLKLLENIEGYIDSFQEAIPGFASSISRGDPKAIEGMSSLYEGVKALETMKENLFALTGTSIDDYGELKTKHKDLTGILNQINDDLENKDYASLADVLEYRLPQSMVFYKELFSQAKRLLLEKRA